MTKLQLYIVSIFESIFLCLILNLSVLELVESFIGAGALLPVAGLLVVSSYLISSFVLKCNGYEFYCKKCREFGIEPLKIPSIVNYWRE